MKKTFESVGIRGVNMAKGCRQYLLCPKCSHTRQHNKNKKCLLVNAVDGDWTCLHCHWYGNLGWRKGEGQQEARPQRKAPRPVPDDNFGPLPEVAIRFFLERKIPLEVLERNKVAWKSDAIAFRYYAGGKLVNVKYRTLDKRFWMHGGAELCFYGLNDIDENITIIVEGEIDKLALEAAGFRNVVSVPNGAPAPDTKDYTTLFQYLEADKDRIESVDKWILAVDSDEPGQRLRDELARRLGREKCYTVEWPPGCKDANDVLKMYDAEELAACINEAIPFPVAGIFKALDVSDRIDHLFEHGWEKGVKTGWPSLDMHYTVRPGEMTIVTGIPGHGKSNFLDCLAVNLAKLHGWCIGVFSPENQPLEDHVSRLIEKFIGRAFHGEPWRMAREQMEDGKQWVNGHFIHILPNDSEEWTIDNILSLAKIAVFRHGIQGLIIDPWNEIESSRPNNITETEYISSVLKKVRQFARAHSVHVWFVAHPMKLNRNKEGGYPIPTPYDIGGSAHWRNKADNCLTIWRDMIDNPLIVEIHIQKIRFRQVGKVGRIVLAFRAHDASYQEITPVSKEKPASYWGGYHEA